MSFLLTAVLLAPKIGLLWSGAVANGQPQVQVSRKDDGNLNVNIPDRYVYQKYSYVTPTHDGGALAVAIYEVIPSITEKQQAKGPGIRDTTRTFAPMRMEFSTTSSGDQVEVYSDVYSYRVVIYRKVK